MSGNISYFLFVFMMSSFCHTRPASLRGYIAGQMFEFDDTDIFQQFGTGTMNNYLSPSELQSLMTLILAEYPEVVRPVSIGKTYSNNDIAGYLIGTNFTEDWKTQALSRPAILIDGLHHARELTGLSMQMYTLLRLLFEY